MSRVQLDAPQRTPLIQVEGVHKRFATRGGDVVALEGVSLDVAEREFISLLGPSGCGKSTLVRLLAQLDRPTEGSLRLNLPDVDRTAVSVAFQDYSILHWKTVENNVAFGRSEEHTSELQSLMRTSYDVFCLKTKKMNNQK